MNRIPRSAAIITAIALVFQCALPALASNGASLEGTVAIPCDPSRISEIGTVQLRSVSGESLRTVAVDPATGAFLSQGMAAGEYEIMVFGVDGEPVSPEPKTMTLQDGLNKVIMNFEPADCGEQEAEPEPVQEQQPQAQPAPQQQPEPAGQPSKPRKKRDLKDWHLTMIYVGFVGAAIVVLDDDEDPSSPVIP